jgi:hypothetical protein
MGVAIGAAVFLLSGGLLLRTVLSFRRAWREAEILRVPAVTRQTVCFPAAGEMALYLEGPRFRTWQQRCTYTCTDGGTGMPVPVTSSYSGAAMRGRRHSRILRGTLTVPRPGEYVFEVAGLQPPDSPEYAVVFMRLFAGHVLRFILTCVLLGMLLIGSLVLAILSALL